MSRREVDFGPWGLVGISDVQASVAEIDRSGRLARRGRLAHGQVEGFERQIQTRVVGAAVQAKLQVHAPGPERGHLRATKHLRDVEALEVQLDVDRRSGHQWIGRYL